MLRHIRSIAALSLQLINPRGQGRNLRFQRLNLFRDLIRWMTWGAGHARTLTHY